MPKKYGYITNKPGKGESTEMEGPSSMAGYNDSMAGDDPIRNTHSTPHQKTLPEGLGKEKAEGMGKVGRIGMKRKKS